MSIEKQFVVTTTADIKVLVTSESSNGALNIFTETAPPGGGPPPHIHSLEDEFIMPIEGQFELFLEGRWSPLPPEGVYSQRGQLHTWRNAGTSSGTVLFVTTPGGLDKFLAAGALLKMPDELQKLIEISAEHGITYPALG